MRSYRCYPLLALLVYFVSFTWWASQVGRDERVKNFRLGFEHRLKSLGVQMVQGDIIEDSTSDGWVDVETYYHLKLTTETYDALLMAARRDGEPYADDRQWPWSIPDGAKRFRIVGPQKGRWMIFVPDTHQVFLCWW